MKFLIGATLMSFILLSACGGGGSGGDHAGPSGLELEGRVTTFAGAGQGYQDTDLSTVRFNKPVGLVFDGGIAYLADSQNQRIRRIFVRQGVVDNIAGDGVAGFSDDTGTAASFNDRLGVASRKLCQPG